MAIRAIRVIMVIRVIRNYRVRPHELLLARGKYVLSIIGSLTQTSRTGSTQHAHTHTHLHTHLHLHLHTHQVWATTSHPFSCVFGVLCACVRVCVLDHVHVHSTHTHTSHHLRTLVLVQLLEPRVIRVMRVISVIRVIRVIRVTDSGD
jgi:hypothetical protein